MRDHQEILIVHQTKEGGTRGALVWNWVRESIPCLFCFVCLLQGFVADPWGGLLRCVAGLLALVVPAVLFHQAARRYEPQDFGWWILVSFGILVFVGVASLISGALLAAVVSYRLSGR